MVNPADYLVLDVETNGLNAAEDDLLSISIYKPDDGRMYDRLLPLEKQTKLNKDAARVHGITKRDLRGKKPLNQEELSLLINEFEMDKRMILTYGGKRFDERFVRQYLQDHDLVGLEDAVFLDFKTMVHSSGDRFYPASKDNLCIAFGIEGVREVHTSANDCLLEWQLFERMDGHHLLVTEANVFKLMPGYLFPASYLDRYSGLREYAGIPKRYVIAEKVFEQVLSEEESAAFVKYPNNFTGNAFEHLVNTMLHAVKVDSREFLLENKMKLEYVGSFEEAVENTFEVVNTERKSDGSVALSSADYDAVITELLALGGNDALADILQEARDHGCFGDRMKTSELARGQYLTICTSPEHVELGEKLRALYRKSRLTDSITHTNMVIKPLIEPLVGFLSELLGPEVQSQQLMVNSDDGCLALCDLSSDIAVVEIKTGKRGLDLKSIANQLYYSSGGRDCFVLHIEWKDEWNGESWNENTAFVVEKIRFSENRPRRRRKIDNDVRIRHAVMDWRSANPDAESLECAKALWLRHEDVQIAWAKSDPERTNSYVTARSKKWGQFKALAGWRKDNPNGLRIDCASERPDISLADIEKWWFSALSFSRIPSDEKLVLLYPSDERIRETIPDLVDKAIAYSYMPDDEVSALQDEVEGLFRRLGISPTSNALKSAYTLFARKEECSDYGWGRHIEALMWARDYCLKELESGVQCMRIPLSMTRYKKRASYFPIYFSSDGQSIEFEKASTAEDRNQVAIFINKKKSAVIGMDSGALFQIAEQCVGKDILRVFIECSKLAPEGELVIAVCDHDCPELHKEYHAFESRWEF